PFDLVAAVVFAVAVWLLSTLIPAWRVANQDATVVLASGGKGTSSGGSNKRAGLLVGAEVVISSLVLVICGSMVLAVNHEVNKPSGVETAHVVLSTYPSIFDARFAEPSR